MWKKGLTFETEKAIIEELPKRGFEPLLTCVNWTLNPACLPVSPLRHNGNKITLFLILVNSFLGWNQKKNRRRGQNL